MTKTLIGYNDRQAMFNTAVAGIEAQDWQRSVRANGLTCAYRGTVGKCAIGHLIRDEDYETQMDDNASTPSVLSDFGITLTGHFYTQENYKEKADTDYYFLMNMQRAHDGATCHETYNYSYPRDELSMQQRLALFAKDYSLELPDSLKPYADVVRPVFVDIDVE